MAMLALWSYWLFCNYAWVAEDAYITFRTVHNFSIGHGLTWNPHERVQAFTNPLWMLLHLPFYLAWPNIDVITLCLSLTCAVLSMVVSIATFRLKPVVGGVFLLVPYLFSKTLRDYSFSGLENALSLLLFSLFYYVLWRNPKRPRWGWLSLLFSLALVNRLDTFVFYTPTLLYLLARHRGGVSVRGLLAGSAPLWLWFGFSLFYFGFPFPNTKYAKLDTGISESVYLNLGIKYLINFVLYDPVMALVSALASAAAVAAFFLRPSRADEERRRDEVLVAMSLGVLSYTIYVMTVGGTVVCCRFMSLVVFAGLWILLAFVTREPMRRPVWAGLLAAALYSAIAFFHSATYLSFRGPFADSFHFYVVEIGSGNYYGEAFTQPKGWDALWAETNAGGKEPPTDMVVNCYMGMPGYYGNTDTYFLDTCGLTSALLARLPATHLAIAGRGMRDIPKGLIHQLKTGDYSRMNPYLAEYARKLNLVTMGDLWSVERLETVALFNLGYYDKWRNNYFLFKDKH